LVFGLHHRHSIPLLDQARSLPWSDNGDRHAQLALFHAPKLKQAAFASCRLRVIAVALPKSDLQFIAIFGADRRSSCGTCALAIEWRLVGA
jgi:hypothetical protein